MYLYFESKRAMPDALCDHYEEMIADSPLPALQNPDPCIAVGDAIHVTPAVAEEHKKKKAA